ncbi:hypothetical protein DI09_28p90 [Mitosporidium daphniae]|uniref:Uncharacterized protein n=1 Tax=Mitosporidium daphniae TaxID=1485682 RepID=A0A098VRP4_9MICR|nr:uncharacterized protein DI09_28p90 [Mitosporidium daphniae]KGG51728.1 hypothetical protein DI09_28p90 [Mitosporidium daphniae]|eukprot:XP_013238180.1 uncharacterized protein DI09_28p90 [Mitosporidium daphniae]
MTASLLPIANSHNENDDQNHHAVSTSQSRINNDFPEKEKMFTEFLSKFQILNEICTFVSKNIFAPLSAKDTTSTLDAELGFLHSECTKKRGLFDISRRILRFCQKRKKEDLADEEPNTTSNALGNGAANKGENTMLYDGSDDILIKRITLSPLTEPTNAIEMPPVAEILVPLLKFDTVVLEKEKKSIFRVLEAHSEALSEVTIVSPTNYQPIFPENVVLRLCLLVDQYLSGEVEFFGPFFELSGEKMLTDFKKDVIEVVKNIATIIEHLTSLPTIQSQFSAVDAQLASKEFALYFPSFLSFSRHFSSLYLMVFDSFYAIKKWGKSTAFATRLFLLLKTLKDKFLETAILSTSMYLHGEQNRYSCLTEIVGHIHASLMQREIADIPELYNIANSEWHSDFLDFALNFCKCIIGKHMPFIYTTTTGTAITARKGTGGHVGKKRSVLWRDRRINFQ